MKFRPIVAAIALILVSTLSGCNDSSSTSPTPMQIDVSGRWISDITVQGITSRMTWNLTQSGTAVTGPVNAALANGIVLLNGLLTGTISGSSLAYTIGIAQGGIPSQPACAGQVGGTMTVASGATSMSGNMAVTSSTCTLQLPTGTVTLTKQP
jgi:hypothetical protein